MPKIVEVRHAEIANVNLFLAEGWQIYETVIIPEKPWIIYILTRYSSEVQEVKSDQSDWKPRGILQTTEKDPQGARMTDQELEHQFEKCKWMQPEWAKEFNIYSIGPKYISDDLKRELRSRDKKFTIGNFEYEYQKTGWLNRRTKGSE